jgi:malate dehydrogenase (oxaloacetate-decarboxylating)
MTSPDNEQLDKAGRPARISSAMHRFYAGKMETVPRCQIRSMDDFSVWYSPGVAQPCLDIRKDPDLVYELTGKANTVAVISDGSRVLGLGDIGAKAGLPVMEGKAMLYKYLGGVDSIGLMLDEHDPERFIEMVLALQPSFGGVNLEDISSPKCFYILDELRKRAEIPMWHDDQQGTATVTLAGLLAALRRVGKQLEDARIAFIGTGAANTCCARLIYARGAQPARCMHVNIDGILGKYRADLYARAVGVPHEIDFCERSNAEGRRGGIAEALAGMDVVISLAQPGPGVIKPEWVRTMNKDAIVFVCANPTPEIWPWEALEAGAAIVATGRSDFPNQVNNSLCFPGIFRGTLDVRARTITDEMCFAAAEVLATFNDERLKAAGSKGLRGPDAVPILPTMADWQVMPRIAAAVGRKAVEQGIARIDRPYNELYAMAEAAIRRSQGITVAMMRDGFIPPAPELP